MKHLVLLSCVAVFASACGGSTGSSGGGTGSGGGSGAGGGSSGSCTSQMFTPTCSCDYHVDPSPGLGTCSDYGTSATISANLDDGGIGDVPTCQTDGGAASCGGTMPVGICPTANRVGSCWYSAPGNAQRYYSPSYTTSTAETDCNNHTGNCFTPN